MLRFVQSRGTAAGAKTKMCYLVRSTLALLAIIATSVAFKFNAHRTYGYSRNIHGASNSERDRYGETFSREGSVSGRDKLKQVNHILRCMGGAYISAVSGSAHAAGQEGFTSMRIGLTEEQGTILFEPQSDEVIKSQGDDRDYRSLKLSNELRVLLVSDPDASLAAAAIDVHVGSTSDPDDVPGLAHFCEHMSFLGTKKYPKEDDFSGWLSSHGGSTNAYTDQEDTVYYFDVNSEFLDDGLDRFSQFFINPTFTRDGTDRELNAIESEHSKNINDDGFRLFQLEKDICNSNHPYHKFSTGNKETLENLPKKKSIDVREELLKFHDEHYSSNQMTLCIYGKQDVATLEKWARKHFADIPNKAAQAPELGWWGKISPYPYNAVSGPQQLQQSGEGKNEAGPVLEIVPAGAARRLSLQWPIWVKTPSRAELLHHVKPEAIVSHLIGHEGKGSVRSLLATKGWINDLRASIGTDLSDLMLFEVSVDLTEDGFKHRDDVIEAIYSYISLLKDGAGGIPPYIFKEVEQQARISFDFKEKSDPSDYASGLSADMQTFHNPAEYLSGPRLFKNAPGVTEKEVQGFLSCLQPRNAQVFVIGREFDGKTQQTQQWYGTHFTRRTTSAQQLARWGSAKSSKYPELALPVPNELIPTDFTLLGGQGTVAEAKRKAKRMSTVEKRKVLEQPPHRILKEEKGDRWEIWHKLDYSFQQPRVYAIISLAMDKDVYNPLFVINSRLFTMCFMESINEYLYEARLAGLNFNLEFTSRGAQMTLSGFNNKLPVFAERMLGLLKDFKADITSYERFRDVQQRELVGWKTQQPYYHANYYANQALETLQYTIPQLQTALNQANIGMLDGFLSKTVGKESFGTALFSGNIDVPGSRALVEKVDAIFPFQPLPGTRRSRRRAKRLPLNAAASSTSSVDGTPALELDNPGPNPNDDNSASAFYYQMPSRSAADTVLVELLADVVEQPFYDSLRTKQQLGYIVYAGVRVKEAIATLLFVVQSSVKDGPALSERVEEFLYEEKYLPSLVAALSEADFEAYKEGIRSRKLEPDQRLTAQAGRFWGEISQQQPPAHLPEFDRAQREVAALNKVTLKSFKQFVKDFIGVQGTQRRLLVSEITAPKRASSGGGTERPTRVALAPIKGFGKGDLPEILD